MVLITNEANGEELANTVYHSASGFCSRLAKVTFFYPSRPVKFLFTLTLKDGYVLQ